MKKTIELVIAAFMFTGLLTACGTAQADHSTKYLLDEENLAAGTDEDKDIKYKKYLEAVLVDDIMGEYADLKNVDIILSGDIDEMQANICLELQDNFTKESTDKIAQVVSAAIGDETMEKVTIQDTEGNMLFPENN